MSFGRKLRKKVRHAESVLRRAPIKLESSARRALRHKKKPRMR